MRIYLATSNRGKLKDFRAAAGAAMEIVPVPGMAGFPVPAEDQATFAGNARKKAEHYSRLFPGELVLADDSGLEVEALGGAPGVRSARYAAMDTGRAATGNAGDRENNARLLRELANVPDSERGARFVCALAVARDGQTQLTAEGEVAGSILREPRGSEGFGYDPLFLVPALGKTMAEITPEEKARVSHRGQALRNLLKLLKS
jgi:XTP/dITP diphosphohydrolase